RVHHPEAPVDSTAFDRLRRDFLKAPVEKWGAILSSVGAALTYLLLLVLLYLFVDLLVWRGQIPTYAQLTPTKQQEFADEWAARAEADRAEAARRAASDDATAKVLVGGEKVRPPTAEEWEKRWKAGMYLALRERVGQSAADTYLPENPSEAAAEAPRLGILSLVARERNRWTGHVVGWLASWNIWAWRPGTDGSANSTY